MSNKRYMRDSFKRQVPLRNESLCFLPSFRFIVQYPFLCVDFLESQTAGFFPQWISYVIYIAE